jgi:hypothetical protein
MSATALVAGPAPEVLRPSATVADLVRDLRTRVPQPVDTLEIAAVVESMGITDAVAREDYGAADTFDLAGRAFALLRVAAWATADQTSEPISTRLRPLRPILEESMHGALALAPVATFVGVFLLLVASGWSVASILALSVGMTIGMVPTNGFIQAIGRRTSIYLGLEDNVLAGRFLVVASAVALAAIAVLAGTAVLVTTAVDVLGPWQRILLAVGAITYSAFWLAAAALSLARAGRWVIGGLGAGIAVGLAVTASSSPIVDRHAEAGVLAGYAVTMAVMVYAWTRLYGIRPRRGAAPVALPPIWALVFELMPYFAYGAFVMALLVEPHVLGWLGATPGSQPRLDAVQTIEFPLTVGLVPILLASGAAERSMTMFWKSAARLQVATAAADPLHFRGALVRLHRRRLLWYRSVSMALGLLTLVAFEAAFRLGAFPAAAGRLDVPMSEVLLLIALLACWHLGVGQFNCMFLLGLGRAGPAMLAALGGVAALTLVGVPLVAAGYQYTPLAFVAGTTVFALLSLLACRRVLARADYHYATAF